MESLRRKQFFFEKKNQKTFACRRQHLIGPYETYAGRIAQKFFGSFFQKRTASFLQPTSAPTALRG
jgi:hypothetical protein